MNPIREARTSTILLFPLLSLGMLGLFLVGYLGSIVQAIQDSTQGLIHRALLLNIPLTLMTVAGILIWYEKLRLQDIGIVFGKLPLAMVFGVFAWIIIQGTESIVGVLIKGRTGIIPDWQQNSLANLGLLIGHFFGTALWEEIAFRGFLLKQCFLRLSGRTGNKALVTISSILVSQLVFMLFHIPWKLMNFESYPMMFGELAGVLLTGIIYAILYLRTDNLFLVVVFHALGNAPTPLMIPVLGTNNILLLFMILIMAFWPLIERWGKGHLLKNQLEQMMFDR